MAGVISINNRVEMGTMSHGVTVVSITLNPLQLDHDFAINARCINFLYIF